MVDGTRTHVPVEHAAEEEKKTAQWIFGGSVAEGLVAAGGIVLAILGLIGIYPVIMVAAAIVTLGAALLLEGLAIMAKIRDLLEETSADKAGASEIATGTSVESLGGAAAVTLGVLALLGMIPSVLLPIAVIVAGACAIFGAGSNARLDAIRFRTHVEHPMARQATQQAVMASTGIQVMVGLAAIVLGILALNDISPLVLTLVAVLVLGGSLLLSGGALASRMAAVFR